jgi:hypothetical protein
MLLFTALNFQLSRRLRSFISVVFAACTKGLWIWTEVIPSQRDDGKPVNILVIDTEGIGALSADHTHDTRIFTLALLLSSLFVYTPLRLFQPQQTCNHPRFQLQLHRCHRRGRSVQPGTYRQPDQAHPGALRNQRRR